VDATPRPAPLVSGTETDAFDLAALGHGRHVALQDAEIGATDRGRGDPHHGIGRPWREPETSRLVTSNSEAVDPRGVLTGHLPQDFGPMQRQR
jgi:hypothetical protein